MYFEFSFTTLSINIDDFVIGSLSSLFKEPTNASTALKLSFLLLAISLKT
jgi:hypothetical protein